MRRHFIYIFGAAVMALSYSVGAQPPRTVKGVESVEQFRPVGDRRIWTFVSRDSVLGQVVSGVEEKTTVDGEVALRLAGGIRVDFRRIGGQTALATRTEHKISTRGEFLEDNLTFPVTEDKSEELRLSRNGKKLEGYYTRNGAQVSQTIDWPRGYQALDGNFVDQLEIFLATRDLTEGAFIGDTLFVPQLLSFTSVRAQIGGVEWRELWKGRFDTVIGVHFTEPQQMSAFMTLDHRLVRVDFPGQQYRVFQDVVQQAPSATTQSSPQAQKPKLGTVGIITLALDYLAFAVFAALVLLVVAARAFRWSDSYVGLLFGAIVFGLVLITQIPAQKYVVANLLLPGLRQGESLYFLGILPALVGGVLQELLKLLGIFAVQYHRQTPATKLIYVGAFVGAAFGIAEAVYITQPVPIGSWVIFERVTKIAFHIASGALLAVALESVTEKKYMIIGGTMFANSAIFYLPVFAQQAAVTPGALHFWMSAITIAVLVTAIFMTKKFRPMRKSPAADPPADTVKP